MNRGLRLAFSIAAAGILVATSLSYGQDKPVRVRGTIEKVDGQNLEVKSRDGKNVKVVIPEKARFTAIVKAALSDLAPDTFVGVTAMPQADGSQRALAIHIFLPAQRGVVSEGSGPWDLQPGSTMTNAAIATSVAGTDGQVVTVRYKDKAGTVGEQRVMVTPQTAIVRYAPGDVKELKPGVGVFLINARLMPDGSVEAPNVSYGRDGVVPPM